MSHQQELEQLAAEAFAREARQMDLDLDAAARRLAREVDADRRRRLRRRVGALVAAGVLALGGTAAAVLLGGEGGGDDEGLPATGPTPPTTTGAPLPGTDVPAYLDVDLDAWEPMPPTLLPPDAVNSASYAVSPDGRWVARTSCVLVPAGCSGGAGGVVARPDGRDSRALPIDRGETVGAPVWSPDSRWVAYQLAPSGGRKVGQVQLYEVATGRTRELTRIARAEADLWSIRYSFSADGTSLLYDLPRASRGIATWDVWSQPLDGGPATVVIPDAEAPEALPYGSGIVYARPMPGSWQGSEVRLREGSGRDRLLVRGRTGIEWVRVSPDGLRLAYLDGGTHLLDLESGSSRRVADGDLAAWADDHTLIISPQP